MGAAWSTPPEPVTHPEPAVVASSSIDDPSVACEVCGEPCTERCMRCKEAFYCGQMHRVQHTSSHHLVCGKPRPQPARSTLDAIFFPANAKAPRLVQLQYVMRRGGDGTPWMNPDTDPWFIGGNGSGIPDWLVRAPGGQDFSILYREDFLAGGAPLNRCVRRLVRGRSTYPFRNNFLAVRLDKTPNQWGDRMYQSACMADVPVLVEGFVQWGGE